MAKRKDGDGSVRQLQDGSWECLMQSKYVNENGRPKRIKRKAATEQEAIKECRLALKAYKNTRVLHGRICRQGCKKQRHYRKYI